MEKEPFLGAGLITAGNIQLNIADANKLELGGSDAGNYKFSYTSGDNSGLSGKITQKTLTLKMADLQVIPKAYKAGDKSATVTVKIGSSRTVLNDVVAADVGNVAINIADGTFEFATATKGNNKQVNWKNKDRITLTGSAKSNYTLNLSSYTDGADSTLKGSIIDGAILLITANVNNRAYDGSTALTLNGTPTISGWKDRETLDKTYANVFTAGSKLVANAASKNTGTWGVRFTGLTLKPAYTNAGYTLQFAPKAVTINKRTLTVSATAETREYNAKSRVTLKNHTLGFWGTTNIC